MRIAEASVDLLKVPLERPYMAGGRRVDAYWHVLARLRTTDGTEGFGYVVSLNDVLMPALLAATRELAQALPGQPAMQPEAAWARLNAAGRWAGPGGFLNHAIAPLDIALWDLAGKLSGQPLWRLLGGFRDRVPTYASDGLWYSLSLEDLAASARAHVARGFTAMKLRIGREATPAGEVRRVLAVREAVGDAIGIMVDATETWDVNRAMAAGQALQEVGIHWLEDPVSHQNLAGMARLTRQLRVPIATGEHLHDAADFLRLFQAEATGIAIIDLARIGGITPWRRVAALAQAFEIPVCGHVLPEVHVHLLAACPNGQLAEYVPRSEAILQAMPEIEAGIMRAPEAPGLGLALNAAAVARCRVG